MQYSEMSDDILAIAHTTWEHMATTELERIDAQGGLRKADQSLLNALGWYMEHYKVIMEEFASRVIANLKYSVEDVFLHAGQKDRSAIFTFYPGTAAYQQYGEYVQGKIIYAKRERDELEQAVRLNPTPRTEGAILLHSHKYNDTRENIDALKVQGFSVRDVMKLQNFTLEDTVPNTYVEEGIKEIPNTVDIKIDVSGIDPVLSYLRITEDIIKMGRPVLEHALVKYYAYLYLVRPELVSPEIASKYLIDPATGKFSEHVRYTILDAKFDRNVEPLSDDEFEQFKALRFKLMEERLAIILKGLGVSKKTYGKLYHSNKEVFYGILSVIQSFEIATLSSLESEYPVFWDFERFSHVITRHYEGLKIAESTYFSKPNQTPSAFQYTYRDVIRLVKIVVKNLAREIDAKLSKGEAFVLIGNKGYYYNGNYYAIRIASNGKLMQFHPIK